MKSTMITTIGCYTIVKLKQDDRITWVACRDYNDSSEEGTRFFLSTKPIKKQVDIQGMYRGD